MKNILPFNVLNNNNNAEFGVINGDDIDFAKIKHAVKDGAEIYTTANSEWFASVDVLGKEMLIPLFFSKKEAMEFGYGKRKDSQNIVTKIIVRKDSKALMANMPKHTER